MDRVVLVGAPDRKLPRHLAEEHLEELTRLTDTAGGEVVGTIVQRIDRPHPRFYVGEGKARELAALVEKEEGDLVVSVRSGIPPAG